ncbi:MAG: type II toxin-antitoxin system RelE/ParE family toxin [Myxococcaceae bacterium]
MMPVEYRLEFNKRYLKDLEKIPKVFQKSILQALAYLKHNPRPDGCKKMRGFDDLYRIRCGDYRIVYQIHDNVLLIIVIDVGHRKEIYR